MSQYDKADILNIICNGIDTSIPVAVSSANEVCDTFEVYFFNPVLSAAQQEGATIAYETIDSTVPNQLVFRTSPGWIYRKSANTAAFTHAILRFDNAPSLEVHLRVYVAGDISIASRTKWIDSEGLKC